jgi:N-acetyl-anhydromuramyl-L-alanine amidase AmpD
MKTTVCLLDSSNPLIIDGISLGRRVLSSGKKHLWEERSSGIVDVIVLHYMSASTVMPRRPFDQGAIFKIFCDYGVSSHFLVNRRGKVFLLVPGEKKAWHSGGSIMPEPDNRRGVNDFSLGVELVATAESGFTLSQYRAAARLCADLEKRYKRKFIYTGHDRIAGPRAVKLGLRKDAKVDPGELFDWKCFYRRLETARESLP